MFYKFGQMAHVHTPTAIRNQDARFDRVTLMRPFASGQVLLS
ncbi:hypothetical protein UG55_10301 [Frankia sp. EI5c]|nr:hypothetical protein UG55_10301 [Frankia sp. EI5c]